MNELENVKEPKYWCANFDTMACLGHGIEENCWVMQYQYSHGNLIYQGDRLPQIATNWRNVGRVKEGDWLVAFLPRNRLGSLYSFYAIGKVRTPRKAIGLTSDIETYLSEQESHNSTEGCVQYTEVFYEDFSDPWRLPERYRRDRRESVRYPQRLDVEKWMFVSGVDVEGLGEIPIDQIQLAIFEIDKDFFEEISNALVPYHEETGEIFYEFMRNRGFITSEVV